VPGSTPVAENITYMLPRGRADESAGKRIARCRRGPQKKFTLMYALAPDGDMAQLATRRQIHRRTASSVISAGQRCAAGFRGSATQ